MSYVIYCSTARPELLTNTRVDRWCDFCFMTVPAGEPVMKLTRSSHAHPACWENHLAKEDARVLDELAEVDLAVHGTRFALDKLRGRI